MCRKFLQDSSSRFEHNVASSYVPTDLDSLDIIRPSHAITYLKRKTKNKNTLEATTRITRSLYKNYAPQLLNVVPYANEREFSTKLVLKDLVVPSQNVLYDLHDFTRQYFKFPKIAIEYISDRKYLTCDLSVSPNAAKMNNIPIVDVVLRVDRHNDDTQDFKMTTKARLFHKKFNYFGLTDVTCSVAYETKMPDCFNFMAELDLQKYATKTQRVLSLYTMLHHNDRVYTFRVAFRTVVKNDRTLSRFCEIDIECEDTIEYEVFSRLAVSLFDYYAYQYHNNDGCVDDLLCRASSWDDFKDRLPVDVAKCLSSAAYNSKNAPLQEIDNERRTNYDDLLNFVAVRCMIDHDPQIAEHIVENSEKLYQMIENIHHIEYSSNV